MTRAELRAAATQAAQEHRSDFANAILAALDDLAADESAIRQHRDERGDDRCHADDGRLYAVLPEGDTRPATETAVTLENCAKFIECRQTGREYVSPQRRIEELEARAAAAEASNREYQKLLRDIGERTAFEEQEATDAKYARMTGET